MSARSSRSIESASAAPDLQSTWDAYHEAFVIAQALMVDPTADSNMRRSAMTRAARLHKTFWLAAGGI